MEKLARRTDLIEQEVGDELLLYDRDRNHLHRLNRTAASLWHRCDGNTTDEEMVDLVRQDLQQPVNAEDVHLGLDRLAEADLLVESKSWTAQSLTRRRMITKLGAAAGAGLLVPVVESIVVPRVAEARNGPS